MSYFVSDFVQFFTLMLGEEMGNNFTYDEICQQICLFLRVTIRNQKMIQEDVVKKCEDNGFCISQATISNIMNETGGKSISLRTLFAICKSLSIPMSELFYAIENNINIYDKLTQSKPKNKNRYFIFHQRMLTMVGLVSIMYTVFRLIRKNLCYMVY